MWTYLESEIGKNCNFYTNAVWLHIQISENEEVQHSDVYLDKFSVYMGIEYLTTK